MADEVSKTGITTKLIYFFLTVAGIVGLYYMFRKPINRFLGFDIIPSRPEDAPIAGGECGRQFFAKVNGKIYSVLFDKDNTNKYYKTETVLDENGLSNVTGPVEITQNEYNDLCKTKFHPDYEWYREIPTGGTSGGHRTK